VAEQAFQNLKVVVTNPPVLVLPDSINPLSLSVMHLEGELGSIDAKAETNCFLQSGS
jgi:hypothetical protein